MTQHPFRQVNVVSAQPLGGNPLAVVHDADDLSDAQMATLARWTNLSETTFLLKPTHPEADYRVRIFTPSHELPFAGHPTLGTCHAWLQAGGVSSDADTIRQECGVGLVTIRRESDRLEFAAPPLMRTGPVDEQDLDKIAGGLGVSRSDIVAHQWIDNGPGWCAVMLDSAEQVLALQPNWTALSPLHLGVVGRHQGDVDATVEVRALIASRGCEDPVTGSLNAGLAQWLLSAGLVASPYVAAQGTAMQRQGRVYLREGSGEVWVGGQVLDVIQGDISL